MSNMDDTRREEFIRQVLARTTGSPCARAQERLCAYVDAELDSIGTDLVRGHLEHCGGCAALVATLATMGGDLAALAQTHPGEAFAERVLAATLPWRGRLARRWRRFGRDWSQLLLRPRFAWEAAYVGAMILGLIFGAPASPLREVPGRALTLAASNPVQALEKTPLAEVPAAVERWSASAWDATGAPLLAWAGGARDGLAARLSRAAGAAAPLPARGRELKGACVRLHPGEAAAALGRLGSDLRTIWVEFTAPAQQGPADDPRLAGDNHE